MSSTGDRSKETNYRRPRSVAPGWQRRIRVASVGTAAAALAVLGSLTLTSQQESSAATLTRAAADPVAGGTAPATSPPGMSPAMPGMDMGGSSTGAAAGRPLAPVLGTFGGATAAVLL